MNRLLPVLFALIVNSVIAQSTSTITADSIKIRRMWDAGDSLIQKGEYVSAKKMYDQALSFAQTSPYQDGVGVSYRALGWWKESIGDYNEAVGWYQKALNALKSSDNPRNYILTFNYLAFVFNQLDKPVEAKRYATNGLALARKIGDERLINRFYGVLVNITNKNHQYDSALVYTNKILTYYKANKDWESYYVDLYNSAFLYKNLRQYTRTEQILHDVLAYSYRANDTYMAGYANASLPLALIPLNKLDEAEQACLKALAWAEKTGTDKYGIHEEINGHLSTIWEKRGNFQKALFYYKKQMASHDSVFNATKNRQVAELETRYQTRQKEENIQQLARENTLKTRQIWATTSGVLLLSILLGTLFVLYKRVQQSRQKIAQQSDQLTLMMKELHHRVKNNLAIVSSLLKLQSNRLDDEKAIQAVRVGQQRVEAMSLIHQRLYQTDQVTTVNMREYLSDLAESLMHAYGYQRDDFDLQLAIELKELDVDTAMPLGLIVNELATNAFKYAYSQPEVKRPLLRIELRRQADSGQPGITLEVQDNGPGINEADWQKSGRKASFGKRLIASLTEQLEGQFELFKQNGTLFRLHIPIVRPQV